MNDHRKWLYIQTIITESGYIYKRLSQKVVIYTNDLKKNMKAMKELEEQNFGSLLKRVI